jgi:hypothetical protein|tara:strand:- start:1556 stop:1837 length:282 start_codon:yes stop_codon:yes gene_type:complete
MAIDVKNVELEYFKAPSSKPIKIYVFDENNMERRIIQLDDLLTLINSGRFNGDLSQDHIYYYRTAKERDWYWKRSKIYYEERMMIKKGVTTLY